MPVFFAAQLEKLTAGVFSAVGTPADIAGLVARSLVVSNLMGHDSHGVLRIPSYLEAIEKGACVPAARPSVRRETATTAIVDGNWAFGQLTATHATRLAVEKARVSQVAALAIVRCNHVGRLGEYTEMAAREGMFGLMVGGTFNGGGVTPFGGVGRVLGTNPLSLALPGMGNEPVVADIATSAAAEGKLRVARAKKQPLPPGVILDKEGNPSTDANDYYEGGMLLPFGGHKGYALSVIVDLLGRHLSGAEALVDSDYLCFGKFMVVVNVEAFRPLAEYREAATQRLRRIKAVRPAPGFTEVMLPGEPERQTLRRRTEEGIPLPEDTYLKLREIAEKVGVEMPSPAAQGKP